MFDILPKFKKSQPADDEPEPEVEADEPELGLEPVLALPARVGLSAEQRQKLEAALQSLADARRALDAAEAAA